MQSLESTLKPQKRYALYWLVDLTVVSKDKRETKTIICICKAPFSVRTHSAVQLLTFTTNTKYRRAESSIYNLLFTDRQTDRQTDRHTDTQTHTRTHARTHARTHTHTHTHIHTNQFISVTLGKCATQILVVFLMA